MCSAPISWWISSFSFFLFRPRHCQWVRRRRSATSSNWRCRIWKCPARPTSTRSVCGWRRAPLRRQRRLSIAIRRLIHSSVTNCRSPSKWTVCASTSDGQQPRTITASTLKMATVCRQSTCSIIATISTTQIRPPAANLSSGIVVVFSRYITLKDVKFNSFFFIAETGVCKNRVSMAEWVQCWATPNRR